MAGQPDLAFGSTVRLVAKRERVAEAIRGEVFGRRENDLRIRDDACVERPDVRLTGRGLGAGLVAEMVAGPAILDEQLAVVAIEMALDR